MKLKYLFLFIFVISLVDFLKFASFSQTKPQLFLPLNFSSGDILFSQDGKYFVKWGFMAGAVWNMETFQPIRIFSGWGLYKPLKAISWDSQYLLVQRSDNLISAADTLIVFNLHTGQIVKKIKSQDKNYSYVGFTLMPQQDTVLFWGYLRVDDWNTKTTINIVNFLTGEIKKKFVLSLPYHNVSVEDAKVTSDGKYLYLKAFTLKNNTGYNFVVRIDLNTDASKEIIHYSYPDKLLPFSSEKYFFLTSYAKEKENQIQQYDFNTGQIVKTLSIPGKVDDRVCTSQYLVYYNEEQELKEGVFDIITGEEIFSAKNWIGGITPDGEYAVIGDDSNNKYSLVRIKTGETIKNFYFASSILAAGISPDMNYFVMSSLHDDTMVWDIETGQPASFLEESVSNCTKHCLAFSPDSHFFAMTDDNPILYQFPSIEKFKEFDENGPYVIVFTPNSKYLVSTIYGSLIKITDVETGEVLHTLEVNNNEVNALAMTSDGKYLFSGDDNSSTKMWDLSTGKQIRTFLAPPGQIPKSYVVALAVSNDNKYVYSLYDLGGIAVKVWDIKSGKLVKTLKPTSPKNEVPLVVSYNSVVVSTKDGHYFVIGDRTGTIGIIDLETGIDLKRLKGHLAAIESINISADNKFVISTSDDGTARIWDFQSGKELLKVLMLPEKNWIVASPEGYFDASDGAKEWMFWKTNDGLLPLNTYEQEYYVPSLLAKVFHGEK